MRFRRIFSLGCLGLALLLALPVDAAKAELRLPCEKRATSRDSRIASALMVLADSKSDLTLATQALMLLQRNHRNLEPAERIRVVGFLPKVASSLANTLDRGKLLMKFCDDENWVRDEAVGLRLAAFVLERKSVFATSGVLYDAMGSFRAHGTSESFQRGLLRLVQKSILAERLVWESEIRKSLVPRKLLKLSIPTALTALEQGAGKDAASRAYVKDLLFYADKPLTSKYINRRLFSVVAHSRSLSQKQKTNLVFNLFEVFEYLGGSIVVSDDVVILRDGSRVIKGGQGFRYFYVIEPDTKGARFFHVYYEIAPNNVENWRKTATRYFEAKSASEAR